MSNETPNDLYLQFVGKAHWLVLIYSAVVIGVVLFYRIIGVVAGQIIVPIIREENGQTTYASPLGTPPGIRVPGGLDWLINSESPYILIFGPVGPAILGISLLMMVRSRHRLADFIAFSLVDTEKLKFMGRRLRKEYGASVFALTFSVLSFVFDVSLTIGVYVGTKAPFLIGWLRFVSDYHFLLFIVGTAISAAMGLWWARTVEFPRDVSFRV